MFFLLRGAAWVAIDDRQVSVKSAAATPYPKAGVGSTRLPAAAAIRYYP
jgi:hypothetical protein